MSLFVTIGIFGQIFDLENLNKLDSLGQKNGIWIEDESLICYKNGKIDGPAIFFEKNQEDSTIFVRVEYRCKNGIPKGPYIYYHPNGIIGSILVNISPNVIFHGTPRIYTEEMVFPYQSYDYQFYPNGNIEAQGWRVFGEDFEIDDEEIGIWKYYTPEGKEKIVDYSKMPAIR